jgi:hypothetical protein
MGGLEMYYPDSWVIVKITRPEGVVHKVLAGWSGGYLDGDHWRMNSGIVRWEKIGAYYHFFGHSGSEYKCHEDGQGLRMATAGVYETLRTKGADQNILVEIVDVHTWNE